MRVVLLGAPSCGKTTQGEVLRRKFGLEQLIFSELLKAAIAKGGPIGQQAKAALSSGTQIPDHVMVQVVEDAISNTEIESFSLEGMPRTLEQVRRNTGLQGA
jgi:adenylate kinase